MMLLATAHLLADITTVWTTKQNNPLYAAAVEASHYQPRHYTTEANAFIRLLSKDYSGPRTTIDVDKDQRKKFEFLERGILILTTGVVAANIEHLTYIHKLLKNAIVLAFDEAQQVGLEEDALLNVTVEKTDSFEHSHRRPKPTLGIVT